MKKYWLSFPLLVALLVSPALPQATGTRFPTPPEPLDNSTRPDRPTNASRRLDLEQLQKEADDLARTAQTIPADMESVRKGVLPKDVIEKLKQIEKLSKRLRSQLNP